MPDWGIWIVLIIAAYLLGSVPAAYLVAKVRGIDLRKQGTRQVGSGNLWRLTSRKYGLLTGLFDFTKGLIMVVIAHALGMDIAQQVAVGLATVVGHNWPAFLHFHGGRGAATTLGIVIIIPSINDSTALPAIIALSIVVVGTVLIRSSALPVLVSAASLPATYWAFQDSTATTLAFLAVFLVLVIKRLTAQPIHEQSNLSMKQILLNRFLFDRDIRDRKAWMFQEPIKPQELLEDND
jgi:glycerol-3-phosphate acyltransferase PlsY